ncbi:RNA-directed DNA polymerase, eukaryota [Artemisia annua]|uniref:RNA-directed DNA polymerase, eukaryota n=1 Tax=Artemisia annua TaxID=35608 RepID=A0A2U1MMD1_ARTAN|nr:RNA-directed DNA polymerase, eukaryota [Artemisia annua]
MEPDIDNLSLNEYLEYEREKEEACMRSIRYRRSSTRLPPTKPVYQSPQTYTNRCYVSPHVYDEMDMDNMTIQEYEWYIANQCQEENNHTHMEDPDSVKDEGINTVCVDEEFGDVDHGGKDLFDFSTSPIANVSTSVCEQDIDNFVINITIEEVDVQEECDEWGIDHYWDMTVEDFERLILTLTPTMQHEVDPKPLMQPYLPPVTNPNQFNEKEIGREILTDMEINVLSKPIIQPHLEWCFAAREHFLSDKLSTIMVVDEMLMDWMLLEEALLEHVTGNADTFNSFIDDASLIDLPLGGRIYTWMNKAATKMSKLDRFLVSTSVMDALPDLKVTALPRGWWDRIPLMLHKEKVDYGPVPFKFFHSWLQRDGFDECIRAAYAECSQGGVIEVNLH